MDKSSARADRAQRKDRERHREKAAVRKPRSEASRKAAVPTPGSWTSSPRSCETKCFCCVSHPPCGILLRQLSLTNAGPAWKVSLFKYFQHFSHGPIYARVSGVVTEGPWTPPTAWP